MRIATTIDWTMIQQVFMRFFTSKKATLFLIIMFISYGVYDAFEWHHYHQMRNDDAFSTHWSWVITTPLAIWWLWADVRKKCLQQFIVGTLFVFLGPVLAMGTELRNLHTFSPTERWEMLACMIIGIAAFVGYIKAKVF